MSFPALARIFSLALFALSGALLPLAAQATPQSGYWWNTAEPGRGFVIEIQGSQMFMAGFLYDVSGRASWVASSGAMTSSTQYSGPLVTYTGGQTLTGAYAGAPHLTAPLGTIAINFSSDTQGSITWPGGTIPIRRFDIVPGGSSAAQSASNPETGWWWNPAEGGRGFAIEVQNGTVYFAGYMYDQSGNPLWYLASGAMGNPVLFQGQWSQFGNGQTLTGAFRPASVVNSAVGSATLQFTNGYSATLTLPNARQIPFIRFAFGVAAPALSAFTPAAAAPESLLTINGTGFDPFGTVTLQLFDSSGYSVTIPAASVSVNSIRVSVPPYIAAASGAFGTSAVQLQATQKSSGVSVTTNTLNGFTIQPLPNVTGTPGQSTLSLLRANLAEAQRLQTAIAGTAQGTAATLAALAQQISNLQTLVTNVQAVVQQGLSFTLGVIGGANIVVTSANIGDVDRLILAALQSLANPSTGSGLNGAQASNPACLATEASAFATAMTSGGGNMDQLAQSLLAATQTSTACGTSSAFGSAYQIFGGAAGVGLGIANGSGVVATKLPGAALFGATTSNASTAVGLNALISPALASQTSSVKSTIAGVAAQSNPTTNQLLAKTTGALATNLSGAQNVTTASSTSSGIQKAKNLINALNSDAGLVTGANAPPAILASFKEQFDAITKSMQLFATCCSGPVTRSFAYGTVTVTSVKVGNTATYTVLVTPTAGGSYTSVWVLTENVSGTVTTASGSVSGNMMPISTGASATIVSGSVSWTQNTAPNSTSTLNLSNFTLAIANNGKGSAEALSLNNLTFTDTLDATGNNFVSASAGGTLTATFGPSIYNITISVSATGNPVTSGSLTVTYGGPNGAFAFADQMTVSGNFATQVWSITQGTINLGGTVGPYDTTKAKPTFPSTFTVYDGTTQIGSYSYKTVSFVDGTFISLTF